MTEPGDPLTAAERARWQVKKQVATAVERVYGSWENVYLAMEDGETLLEIADRLHVNRSSLANHIRRVPGHQERMKQVEEARAEAYADEAFVISENADTESKAGIAKARLRVDTRKWLAGINNPKRFSNQREAPTVNVNLTVNQLHLDALRRKPGPTIPNPGPPPTTIEHHREDDDDA